MRRGEPEDGGLHDGGRLPVSREGGVEVKFEPTLGDSPSEGDGGAAPATETSRAAARRGLGRRRRERRRRERGRRLRSRRRRQRMRRHGQEPSLGEIEAVSHLDREDHHHHHHYHHHHHHRHHRTGASSRDSSASSSPSPSRSRSRSPPRTLRGRRSMDASPSSLTPTPGVPRPTPVPERSQPQPCFVEGCPWRGGHDEVAAHARERHASITSPGPALRLAVPLLEDRELEVVRLVDTLDELFILQLRRRAGSRRRLLAAVRMLGSRTRAARYLYLIQMQTTEGEGEGNDERSSATRVSFLLSPAHSWLDPPESAMRCLWSARHFAKPIGAGAAGAAGALGEEQDVQPHILELSVTIQKVQQ